jgi:hypothetical protein
MHQAVVNLVFTLSVPWAGSSNIDTSKACFYES